MDDGDVEYRQHPASPASIRLRVCCSSMAAYDRGRVHVARLSRLERRTKHAFLGLEPSVSSICMVLMHLGCRFERGLRVLGMAWPFGSS